MMEEIMAKQELFPPSRIDGVITAIIVNCSKKDIEIANLKISRLVFFKYIPNVK